MIHKLGDYKLSKEIIKDLEKLIKLLDSTIKEYEPYRRYKPIYEIIHALRSNKVVLEAHFRRQKRILESKGKVD